MVHKPSGLLGYTERTSYFIGAHAIFSVNDHPNSRKPFIKAERTIFKDSADFNRKLALRVARFTLEALLTF